MLFDSVRHRRGERAQAPSAEETATPRPRDEDAACSAARSVGERASSARGGEDAPGSLGIAEGYLTDGQRLFRVLTSQRRTKRIAFTLLEDCSTLEVYVLTAAEIASLCLRRVVPLAALAEG